MRERQANPKTPHLRGSNHCPLGSRPGAAGNRSGRQLRRSPAGARKSTFILPAPKGRRCESAFALLSHRESNKEVTSAEDYGIINGTGGASMAVKISGMMGTGSMGHNNRYHWVCHKKSLRHPVTFLITAFPVCRRHVR